MTSMRKIIYTAVLMLIGLTINTCTVSYSFTGASIPVEAKTFTVRNIENVAPTINPNLAIDLQNALTDKLLTQTRLAPADYDGDLIYDITITGYNIKPSSISGGEASVATQNRLTVRIKVVFKNRYDKEANFEKNFSQFADYDSSNNFTDVEDGLVQTILEKLVNDVFNESVVNW